MDVHGVMHDFEWAMINSIERWFRCNYHLGCFFHWKQAIRHNMIEHGFSKETVAFLLPKFDFLTVVDKDDIERGVEYIRETVRASKGLKRANKKLFEEFLDQYFIKTWMKKKLIDMFNYNDGDRDNTANELLVSC